jgi:hypothetical protein
LAEQDRYLHPNGQWTSEAASALHVIATARSAVYGRPGFIPAGELAALSRSVLGYPGADLAGLAAELCAALVWKAADGGWRVLDALAVGVCSARVRELRGEPPVLRGQPPARERPPARVTPDGIGRFGEPTAQGDAASFRCARCGDLAGVVCVARDEAPRGRGATGGDGSVALDHFLGGHRRAAAGVALDMVQALIDQGSVDPAAIRDLDWGFWALTPFYCPDCALNYCAADWDISRREDEGFREPTMGRCPAGHEHMLDENLTPDPDPAPAPDPGSLIVVDRSQSFDGRERVLTVAAWDLHLTCTEKTTLGLQPGLVRDYHLDNLGPGAAAAVAELVASGFWEPADGGCYRVLDWIAVEKAVDRAAEERRLAGHTAWLWGRTEQEEVLKNVEDAERDR